MADQNAIYIASISGGKCLENTQQAKGECRLRKWNKAPTQQWLVEPSSEDPNIVAFKSIADGEYLAALQPDRSNGGKIGVQQEKQWFTLEPGRGPGWWHVKCNSSFGSGRSGYLNDEWGRLNEDNRVQTYQFEQNNPGFNTFYLPHAQVADGESFHLPSVTAHGEDGKREELDTREKELQEREDALKEKEKDQTRQEEALAQRKKAQAKQDYAQKQRKKSQAKQDKALKEREAVVARREQALSQEKPESKNSDAAKQDGDADRTKELEERETAVAQREKELAQKETGSEAADAPEQDGGAERAKALEEKEAGLSRKEADLQRREEEVESTPASETQENGVSSSSAIEDFSSSNGHTGGSEGDETSPDQDIHESGDGDEDTAPDQDVHEICRLYRENDNLKAQVRVAELEGKLRELEARLREEACQHKIKQPPRKIDHRVVGYVYQ